MRVHLKTKQKSLQSFISIVSAEGLLLLSVAPALLSAQTTYAGVVEPRSIQMSSSNPSNAGTSYLVTWNPASTTSIAGIVVDFCSNSPIEGNSCTAPAGFNVGGTGATISGVSASLGTGWTVCNSTTTCPSVSAGTIIITNTTAQAQSTTTADDFTITNVVNPSAVGSFYARIFTYSTAATAEAYTSTAPGTYVDDGGIALSTAGEIDLQATVQETLTFCVYTGASCSSANPVSVGLGTQTGGQTVIDSSAVYTSPVNFTISTNAKNTVGVNLVGNTLKDASGDTIPAVGSTAAGITAGTPDFGIYLSTLGTNMSAVAPYSNATTCGGGTGYCYALDTNATTGTTSTYGEEIAKMTGPADNSLSTITYGVTASLTTPSGVYTATHQLIATGSF